VNFKDGSLEQKVSSVESGKFLIRHFDI